MIGDLLHFVAGLSVVGLALLGFVVAVQIFAAWLGLTPERDSSLGAVAASAEREIDELASNAIDDMFDLARNVRLKQRMDGQR